MEDMILVTNWEKVDKDDFYLSKDWARHTDGKETISRAKKLQREGNLFYAYIVPAVNFAIYKQMDAQGVLIDNDASVIVECESDVIGNEYQHREKWEADY